MFSKRTCLLSHKKSMEKKSWNCGYKTEIFLFQCLVRFSLIYFQKTFFPKFELLNSGCGLSAGVYGIIIGWLAQGSLSANGQRPKLSLHVLDINIAYNACGHCVVPENIHTPTTEGISHKTPPPHLSGFLFLLRKIPHPPPPHPSAISKSILRTPQPLWKKRQII